MRSTRTFATTKRSKSHYEANHRQGSGTVKPLVVRSLGIMEYEPVWEAMRKFVSERTTETTSEFWLVEHPPVFTQGQAGKAEHILDSGDIPVIQTDRGGQVTYHGPGQAVIYLLLDLREAGIGIKTLVNRIEQAVINLLANHGIRGERRDGAPGIYVKEQKIASIGLRVKRFSTYHGVSLNVAMDLEPFSRINPCGYSGLDVTDLKSLGVETKIDKIYTELTTELATLLGYTIEP